MVFINVTAVEEQISAEVITSTAKSSAEEITEETLDSLGKQASEEAMKDNEIQNIVDEAVKQAIKDVVEKETADILEVHLIAAIKHSEGSYWKNMSTEDLLQVIRKDLDVEQTVTKITAVLLQGKQTLHQTIQERLKATSKVLETLKVVTDRMKQTLDSLESNHLPTNFGTFIYNYQHSDAGKVVGVLVRNMNTTLGLTQDIVQACEDKSTWDSHVTNIEFHVITACQYLLALRKVKVLSEGMEKLGLVNGANMKKLETTLMREIPKNRDILSEMTTYYLEKAAIEIATEATTKAVVDTIKERHLRVKLRQEFEMQVLPRILIEVKRAAKEETKAVFEKWRPAINRHLAIGTYGNATFGHWLDENVRPDAMEEAHIKAIKAARELLNQPLARKQMLHFSEQVKNQYLQENKEALRQSAYKAARKSITGFIERFEEGDYVNGTRPVDRSESPSTTGCSKSCVIL